jgi:microcystin-dependent protein
MGTPFLAELRLFSFNFAPSGWAGCNGQFLPINQNQALFSLLGTSFGGDGQVNFRLPDLRGRIPIHFNTHIIGEAGGQTAHTVTTTEMPQHLHLMNGINVNGDTDIPNGASLGSFNNGYRAADNLTTLIPATVANVGGSQPHENRQPFTVLNWGIALIGIFPSRN